MLQHIIDRRLAGKNKSVGNRERFLRRYKDQIKEAVKRAIDAAASATSSAARTSRFRRRTSTSRCSTTA
ncbi:MAG: YeaH/YhbH family protein, partial [Aquincola sp.]|nr:YeaH/YhbH family protein [Aquincola sp.]